MTGRRRFEWLALAAALGFAACVDERALFTSTEAADTAADAPGPSPAPTGPSAGSPETLAGGASSAGAPGTNEGLPPLVRVDAPVPQTPGAGPPSEAEPATPADPLEPLSPSEPDPAPAPVDDPTGQARVCPDLAQPLLLDFEQADGARQAFFGDFQSVFSGGTFVYPERVAAAAEASADAGPAALGPGLSSEVSGGSWRVSGLVAEPAGWGVFFDCQSFDASRFSGIAFRIEGAIDSLAQLTFFVGSAGNEVSRAWLLEQGDAAAAPSFGRCTPAATRFDGSCQAARVTLPITAEASEVVVPFAALAGGSPEPGLNPAEITTLQWSLPGPLLDPAGGAPYAIDVRIDDVRFVEAE